MNLDNLDQNLLAKLQNRFPLTTHPFADMGKTLALSGDEVIQRIQRLKKDGIVRQISPVFDARSLRYVTTLIAMQVPEDRLERCSGILHENPYISHAYEREHSFNVWFTLAMPGTKDIEEETMKIADAVPTDAIFQLPASKLFKIGAFFGTEGTYQATVGELSQAAELSPEDRAVVNELQRDLPLTTRPFIEMSNKLGMHEERFLERCRSLLERGIMRRYGAAVNHWKAGYTANAMVCWRVPSEKVDEIGQHLALLREVSHCYERETSLKWPYNLYAMIHGKARETCRELAEKVSRDFGIEDFLVLFSTRELKKTRIIYRV
ncbi:Lrp/AsnC family transcriptional regulator [Chloroflexota bacterium]